MAKETGYLWRCEYANCRHTWIAHKDEPPRRCAKCKKCNWHKTITLQETIRLTNWREQMVDDAKPYIDVRIKALIAQAILDAKKRKGEYVAEVAPGVAAMPSMVSGATLPVEKCGHAQEDWEAKRMGYCGKIKGHTLSHGRWEMGEELDE